MSVWAGIIALACVVYAAGISHESFWYDEAYSAAMAEHPLAQLLSLLPYDNHPPLYYLLLRMVRVVIGNSEWALRLLSVAGAVALVGLGAGPVRRIFGDRTAVIYAAVTCFTPVILIYAHEARMYTLAIFAVTAGALYGYLAAEHNRWGDWVCFGLATLAAACLHYYGLIAAFLTHLFVLIWLLMKKRAYWKTHLIMGVAMLAGYLPCLSVLAKQAADVNKGFWLSPVTFGAVLGSFYVPFVYKDYFGGVQPLMAVAFFFSASLIVCGVVIAKIKRAEKALTFCLFLLFVYLGTVAATTILSLILAPIFYARYMIVCMGLFILLLSLGISLLPARIWQPAAIGIFALVNVLTLKDIYLQQFNHPMKAVAQDLKGVIQPGDLIITSDSYSMGPALYYFPEAVHYHTANSFEAAYDHVLKPLIPPLHYEAGLPELLAAHPFVWYITCNTALPKSVWTILRDEKGWEESAAPKTYSTRFSFVQFTVSKYMHTGRESSPPRGTLNVQITGLKPVGALLAVLYDQQAPYWNGPLSDAPAPYRFQNVKVEGEDLLYTFDGVEYGEYVLVLMHDEDYNHVHDFDGQLPAEGMFILNYEKMDLSSGLEDFTFDKLKFSFNQPEQNMEVKMLYPPFPGQSNK